MMTQFLPLEAGEQASPTNFSEHYSWASKVVIQCKYSPNISLKIQVYHKVLLVLLFPVCGGKVSGVSHLKPPPPLKPQHLLLY